MTPTPFAAILRHTLERLATIHDDLQTELTTTDRERVRLLAGAFLAQHEALTEAVERIEAHQPVRVLGRTVMREDGLGTLAPLPRPSDSRDLTRWLVEAINDLAAQYASLAGERRLRPAANAIEELEALFAAHGRRLAIEAQRFEDL